MAAYNFRLTAVSAICAAALSINAHSARICDLVFAKCPGDLGAGTLNVPQNVIWLDPVIPVCAENVQIQTGANGPPPSIVFIIDNSGSMSEADRDVARFNEVTRLLDTIAKIAPNAEVGLSIFSRRLQFDYRDNPFFKPAFPADPTQHDSYVPLTKLNAVFPDGVTKGVDTLKALLKYTGSGDLIYGTKQPSSRASSGGIGANDIRNGTDITLGFEAAIEAMKASTAAKSDQYFIFLSDGLPSTLDVGRTALETAFEKGVGAPTTFTIFFKASANPTAPASIINMTLNIQKNGYSANNPKSAYWAIQNTKGELLSLLQSSVLNPIFANTPGKPLSAVMRLGTETYNSSAVNATNFTFPKRVPIGPAQTTVNLAYTYEYTDSGKAKTKEVPYVLNLNRTAAAVSMDPGLDTNCREQGDITLFHKDVPIKFVTADYANLDIHLNLVPGETCNGCKVEVKPNKSADKENIAMRPASGYHTGNFGRETINVPKPGDDMLQHLPSDSIIITYVNPDNPLDVIRKAFFYSDVSTVLNVIRHNDYARAGDVVTPKSGEHFILVTPGGAVPTTTQEAAKNWSVINTLATDKDSIRYVGNIIQASRAFKVEIRIYTNLGQFVNKIGFSISQAEFAKLSKSPTGTTRQLKVLWDSRTSDGNLAGTGAYVLKTTVTLLRLPGVAEDEASTTDFRVVGVLRDP